MTYPISRFESTLHLSLVRLTLLRSLIRFTSRTGIIFKCFICKISARNLRLTKDKDNQTTQLSQFQDCLSICLSICTHSTLTKNFVHYPTQMTWSQLLYLFFIIRSNFHACLRFWILLKNVGGKLPASGGRLWTYGHGAEKLSHSMMGSNREHIAPKHRFATRTRTANAYHHTAAKKV